VVGGRFSSQVGDAACDLDARATGSGWLHPVLRGSGTSRSQRKQRSLEAMSGVDPVGAVGRV